MNLKDLVMTLADADGVSGSEQGAAEAVREAVAPFASEVSVRSGNVIARIGTHTEGRLDLLLDAHIDQIGMIVTDITEDGFLRVDRVGGLDRRLLPAQRVVVFGKEKVRGVIAAIAPHLSGGDEKKVPAMGDIAIDIGCTSREEAEKKVSRGDVIRFATYSAPLLGDRITGAALDDRCGAAALIRTAELLSGEELPCNLTLLFSTQEELGERGAQIAAFALSPDIAIAVDVSFALTADETPADCGELEKGAMIGISPTLSRSVSNALMQTAREENLPYQIEVMAELTSTNADRFSVNACGAEACTVSIPLRYMHTPVEVISVKDVENTAALLAAYVRRCG